MADWMVESWESFKDFFKAFMNTLLDMTKDLFYWVFETIMDFTIVLMDGLGAAMQFNPAEYFSAIPPEVSNMIGLIGLGEALVIITSAITIRILLQLIPFTRLGS